MIRRYTDGEMDAAIDLAMSVGVWMGENSAHNMGDSMDLRNAIADAATDFERGFIGDGTEDREDYIDVVHEAGMALIDKLVETGQLSRPAGLADRPSLGKKPA